MLQTREATPSSLQGDFDHLFEMSYYLDILRRRALAFILPFLLILGVGSVAVSLRPAIYVVEGKILLESAQVPSELVRSTVTALANERIQLIEQRIMTRDNLLAIADKFEVFGRGPASPPPGQVAALMRLRTQIKPSEVRIPARPYERQAVAFTVGFEHEQPAIALRVANELITMILNEDVRTRTSLAGETTRFLEQETKKIEAELSAVEVQMAELKRRQAERGLQTGQPGESQLAALRGELAQKTSIFSDTHPDVKALRQKIAALERTVVPVRLNEPDPGIEALERQQASLQKILEASNEKLTVARLGESLERGQRSERLEVLEQPTLPNAPARPNRPKLFMTVLGLALATGAGVVFMLEARDDTIRRVSDLRLLAAPQILVPIPFIETKAEARRRKRRAALAVALLLALVVAGFGSAATLLPVDRLVTDAFAALKPS